MIRWLLALVLVAIATKADANLIQMPISATVSPTISGVTLSNGNSFTTPATTGTTIDTMTATCSVGSCVGSTFALATTGSCSGATNNGSFAISGSNLNIGGSTVNAGSYSIGIAVTLAGATNSGVCYPFTLTGTNPSYSGPGDIVTTGWKVYYSTAEAFTNAYAAGNGNAYDVNNGTTTCTVTFNSTGFINYSATPCAGSTTVATFCTAGCNVSKIYDQTQGGACSGTCDLSNASTKPTYVANCLSTFSCMDLSVSGLLYAPGSMTTPQPWSVVSIFECLPGSGAGCTSGSGYNIQLAIAAGNIGLFRSFSGGAMTLQLNGGGTSLYGSALTTSAWHFGSGTITNVGACTLYADAVSIGSSSCGSSGIDGQIQIGVAAGGDRIIDVGLNTVALSGTQLTNLYNQMKSNLGSFP
jgi:hypothetical protein